MTDATLLPLDLSAVRRNKHLHVEALTLGFEKDFLLWFAQPIIGVNFSHAT
jgi:hypothetical protein